MVPVLSLLISWGSPFGGTSVATGENSVIWHHVPCEPRKEAGEPQAVQKIKAALKSSSAFPSGDSLECAAVETE